jgi:hypothetical protein
VRHSTLNFLLLLGLHPYTLTGRLSTIPIDLDIPPPKSWSVLSPFGGENEIMHFSASPCCVALSPHASIRFTLLASVRTQNATCSKSRIGCTLPNFKPSFPIIGDDGPSTLQYLDEDVCVTATVFSTHEYIIAT